MYKLPPSPDGLQPAAQSIYQHARKGRKLGEHKSSPNSLQPAEAQSVHQYARTGRKVDLRLTDDEKTRYLSQHRGGNGEVFVSMGPAFQIFVTMTLYYAGNAMVTWLVVCPIKLRMRLRDEFFKLGPSTMLVLNAFACATGILGQGTFDSQAYMHELETFVKALTVQHKATIKGVMKNLRIYKYEGDLVQDTQHGFVSSFLSGVLCIDLQI
jgi:hypothetical protein